MVPTPRCYQSIFYFISTNLNEEKIFYRAGSFFFICTANSEGFKMQINAKFSWVRQLEWHKQIAWILFFLILCVCFTKRFKPNELKCQCGISENLNWCLKVIKSFYFTFLLCHFAECDGNGKKKWLLDN